MKKAIPNFITLLNLLSGVVSIYLAFKGYLFISGMLIILGAIFDFLDGMTARLLGAFSEVGKQLDSLSDLVTFGVAPAFVLHHIIVILLQNHSYPEYICDFLIFAPFVIPLFSAYRLAVFNVDTEQTTTFLGMPTPANGIFWGSMAFVLKDMKELLSAPLLIVIAIAFCLLLVSRVPMLSLKFKNLNFKENIFRYILVLSAVVLIAIFHLVAIPIIILFYIFLSLVKLLF